MQADYAGIQVECRTMAEATALGIALMAGVGGHIYASMSEVQQVLHAAAEANEVRRFHPQMTVEERTEKLHRWEQAVERSFGWKQ
jgi:glycerol kinase